MSTDESLLAASLLKATPRPPNLHKLPQMKDPKVIEYLANKIEEIQKSSPPSSSSSSSSNESSPPPLRGRPPKSTTPHNSVIKCLLNRKPLIQNTPGIESPCTPTFAKQLEDIDFDMDSMSSIQAQSMSAGDIMMNMDYDFKEKQEVLARWNDGLYYLGTIVTVDNKLMKCNIRFEDGSQHWSLFKDITVLKETTQDADSDDIHCTICKDENSEKPNEIVLCDHCGLGYHQQCHSPKISSDVVVDEDAPWLCRQCLFASAAQRGGAVKQGPTAKALQDMKQCLPYNINRLHWDRCHKYNSEQCYCYCGGPGEWYLKMLQCCRCKQWFHEACTQCLDQPLAYGDRFYVFVCSFCNSGPEYMNRLEMKWMDLTHLALFNLTIQYNRKYYDLTEDIIPWMNNSWTSLQLENFDTLLKSERLRKTTDCLNAGLKNKFICGKEMKKQTLWGLKTRQPPIPPLINLPRNGRITDKTMEALKIKGNRMFIVSPSPSSSAVPLRNKRKLSSDDLGQHYQEPQHSERPKRARQLNLDTSKTSERSIVDFPSQEICANNKQNKTLDVYDFKDDGFDDNRNIPKQEPVVNNMFILDRLIPKPPSFYGPNHPFKTILEKTEEQENIRIKKSILTWCENGCMNDLSLHDESVPLDTTDNSSGVISWSDITSCTVQKVNDASNSNSISSSAIPVKKRRGRKRKVDILRQQAKAALEVVEAKKRAEKAAVLAKEAKKRAQQMRQIENKVKHYLGSRKAVTRRDGFQVFARRVTPDGKVQYLVQWEGIIS